jgi:glycerol-3-phosphate dehydrogenase
MQDDEGLDRSAFWQKCEKTSFDMVVIGGGITGAGIFRHGALLGLKTLLVEKDDLAYGTSSRSSKLVHGGLRYLEQLNFCLVFESAQERGNLMRLAPNIVKPLPFIMPVYEDSPHPLWKICAGMWLYDILGAFHNYKNHKKVSKAMLFQEESALKQERLKGGVLYYDAATDDSRLTLETVLDGVRAGGYAMSRAEVLSARYEKGRIKTLVIRDNMDDSTHEVSTDCVVVAGGPWTEQVLARLDALPMGPKLRPTKGAHIVFDRRTLPLAHAVVMNSPIDKRVTFAIPWQGATLIGTTDTDFTGSPDDVFIDKQDVDYLITTAKHYFPEALLTPDRIKGTWAGLRPLLSAEGLSPSEISREHKVTMDTRGIVAIAGGKLTTYRVMAVDAMKKVLQVLGLRKDAGKKEVFRKPLYYGETLTDPRALEDIETELCKEHGLEKPFAQRLSSTFGALARQVVLEANAKDRSLLEPIIEGLPFLRVEAFWAARHEMARTVVDFLCRRTPLFYLDCRKSVEVAREVAKVMGDCLGWSASEVEKQTSMVAMLAQRHMAFSG